jgi:hypothetical protein
LRVTGADDAAARDVGAAFADVGALPAGPAAERTVGAETGLTGSSAALAGLPGTPLAMGAVAFAGFAVA